MIENKESMGLKAYRSIEEATSEIERECNVRSRCFPRWIGEGRVNRIDAQDRLDRLASALVLLEELSKNKEVVALMAGIIATKNSKLAKVEG